MTETEQALDEIANILASGGGSVANPTVGILFVGPHVSGTLDQFVLQFDADLVGVTTANVSAGILITNGRTYASFGAGFHPGGACEAMVGQNVDWHGRARFNQGDTIYLDSTGAVAGGALIHLTFERRNLT